MQFRKLAIALFALVLPLSACSGAGDGTSTASPAASASVAPTVDRSPTAELPSITFGEDGTPTMATVDADPPTQITVKTLKSGDGDEVESGALVTVNYAGFLYSDGTQFDTSYGADPVSFSLSQVIDGWRYGLVGAKVGDQLQIVVPPDYGYGDTESGSIPASSTLVFVVDVLGTTTVDTSALSDAVATNAALPEGLTITGDIGEEPILTFAADSTAPTEAQTIVLAEGSGATITDADTVIYHIAYADWGGESSSTWPDQYQQVASGGGEETVGKTIGSRVLLSYPADEDAGTAAQVMVVDLLALAPSTQS